MEFDHYADAQRLVDRLSDSGFPVEHVQIVGTGLRTVKQVMRRMTTGKAALFGGGSGVWLGLLIGLIFGLLTPAPAWISVILLSLALGASADLVDGPVKVLRIGSMILRLLDEVREGPLDEAARTRLMEIHQRSVQELQDGLAPGLVAELHRLWLPLTGGSAASEDELRIGQAQLAGWIGGLVHGIEAAIAAQQAVTRQILAPLSGGPGLPPTAVIVPASLANHSQTQPGHGPQNQDSCDSSGLLPGQYL